MAFALALERAEAEAGPLPSFGRSLNGGLSDSVLGAALAAELLALDFPALGLFSGSARAALALPFTVVAAASGIAVGTPVRFLNFSRCI